MNTADPPASASATAPEPIAPKALDPLPSLPSLPASVGELTGRDSAATNAPPPPLLDDPPLLATGSVLSLASLEHIARTAAAPASREDLWRPALRALATLMLTLFSLRILFDDLFPRLVFAVVLGAVGAVVLAMLLHALAVSRRQHMLMTALKQLTRVVRADPSVAPTLAPQLDAVLSALRDEPRVWPISWLRRPE